MIKFKNKTFFLFVFFISFVSLLSAYTIEHLLGYQPCNLCLISRIPYAIALIIVIINFKLQKNEDFFIILLLLVFSFSFSISVYHFGIEQGFISESSVCGLQSEISITSKDEILKSLQKTAISRKNVAFKIFGLSLTTYNILISLLMILTSIRFYFTYEKYKK